MLRRLKGRRACYRWDALRWGHMDVPRLGRPSRGLSGIGLVALERLRGDGGQQPGQCDRRRRGRGHRAACPAHERVARVGETLGAAIDRF
jgi:hypothetical protein